MEVRPKEEDWGWLHGDSLRRLGCGMRGGLGPEGRKGNIVGRVWEERGGPTTGASFSALTLRWQFSSDQIGGKNESNMRDLWDNIKCACLHIIRDLDGEERERRTENVFEKIVAENFPNVIKETYIQIQEAQRVLNKMNHNRPRARHVKMANIKERILRAAREKQGVHYKEIPRRLSADFLQKHCRPEGSGRIYLKS